MNTLNFHSNTKDAINDTVIKFIDVINGVTEPMFKKVVTRATLTKGTSKLKEPYASKDCHKYNTNKVYIKVKRAVYI